MKYILVISTALFLLASCANSKEAIEAEASAQNEAPTTHGQVPNPGDEHQILFEDITKGDSLFASIKRGYCFGTCPVYEMKIYNSGHAEYTGTHAVDLKGEYVTMLSYEKMKKFIDVAVEISYLEMEDEYDNENVTDLPETTTSIVMGGKRKSVRKRYKYPSSLKAFESVFDDLLKSEKWVLVRNSKE